MPTQGKDATGPVQAAVFAALNVATVTALAEGGVHNRVLQAPTYRLVRVEFPLGKGVLRAVDERTGPIERPT